MSAEVCKRIIDNLAQVGAMVLCLIGTISLVRKDPADKITKNLEKAMEDFLEAGREMVDELNTQL